MRPVTDHNILAQLEQPEAVAPVAGPALKPVTDPNTLAALEGPPLPALKPVNDPALVAQLEAPEPTSGLLAGMGDRVLGLGAKLVRGIGNVVETGGDALERKFPVSGLTEEELAMDTPIKRGTDWLADKIEGGQENINWQPSVEWDPLKQLWKDDPIAAIPQTGRFILEQGVRSIPDMAAVLNPATIPAYLLSRTEEVAEERAKNDGREGDVQLKDLGVAAPVAAAVTLTERVGAKGLLPKGTVAKTTAGRIGKAGAKEAGTEYVEESAEYAGESVGTKKGFDPAVMGERGLQGAVVGGPVGVTGRTVVEGATKVLGGLQNKQPSAPVPEQQPDTVPPQPTVPDATAPVATNPPAAKPEPPVQPAVTQEPEPKTSVTPVTQPEPAPANRRKLATPNNSMEIEADTEVVELSTLRTSDAEGYPVNRQPRDRTSKRSEAQITEIVKNFDPERLLDSRTTDQGAPVIGPEIDNFVESGNGRIMSLRRVYETDPDKAEAYKAALAKAGHDVSSFKNPVLVRRRRTALDDAGLSKFVEDSNRDSKMQQNETEIAKQDARRITPEMISLFRGGSMHAEPNADFRNRFMREIVGSEAEAAGLRDKNGNLTQSGERRIRTAIFQYAYDNEQAVESFFTSAEPDVKSVGDVLQDVAPNYAAARANIQKNGVDGKYDISKNIIEALDVVRTARSGGDPIDVRLKQGSMFGDREVNPITERLVRGIYNKDLSRIASKKAIDNFLRGYADKVRNFDPNQGDVFGETTLPEPAQILDDLLKARDAREASPVQGQGTLAGTNAPSVKPKKGKRAASKEVLSDAAPAAATTQPAGTHAKFETEAFTETTSYARKAFVDAGLDPDRATNFTPERKLQIVKAQLKKVYDIDFEADKTIPLLKAIDQGLELYRNMDQMSYALQMTPNAMGLNIKTRKDGKGRTGSLKLIATKKLRGALGVFFPDKKAIALPGRSNSFAHEWFHAMDFKILEDMDVNGLEAEFSGYTAKVREEGLDGFETGSMAEAWVNLMNAMFFDKAGVAAEISLLEKQLERARTDKSKAEIQRQLDELKNGSSGKMKIRTDFYKRAAKREGGKTYWTKPTEMGARSFEAYIAHKVSALGGSTMVLSKSDAAYMNSVDGEFQLRYPRAEERFLIFHAFDQLFDAMRKADALGQAAFNPDVVPNFDGHIQDMTGSIRPTREVPEGMIQKIRNAPAREIEQFKKDLERRRQIKEERPSSPRSMWRKLETVRAAAFSAERSMLAGLIARYPTATALVQIRNRFMSAPGQGQYLTRPYNDAVDRKRTHFMNRMLNIFKNHGIGFDDKHQQKVVRALMLGNDPDAETGLKKASAQLRKLFDEIWTYADKNGIDIGYVRRKGYLPRLLDTLVVTDPKNHDDFVADAAKLYVVKFEHEVGTLDNLDLAAFIEFIRNEDNLALLRVSEKATIRKLVKLINKLNEADPEERAEIEEQIQEILDEGGFYEQVRDVFSENAAAAWLRRVISGNVNEGLGRINTPAGSFRKTRTLPAEAEEIMDKWYIRDVPELLTHYINGVVRETEWNVRAKPKDGKSLAQLQEDLVTSGMDPADIQTVEKLILNMSGRESLSGRSADMSSVMSTFHMLGTVTMLTKAAALSIPEGLVTGLRTGNALDGLRVINSAVRDVVNTEDAQDIRDIVEFAGIYVQSAAYDTTLQNRMGGIYSDTPHVESTLSKFFVRSGLTHLTSATRRWIARVHMGYLRRLSARLLDPDYKHQAMLANDLREIGIPTDKQKQFAEFVTSFNGADPKLENLLQNPDTGYAASEMGELYMEALTRLNRSTVMDPNPEDRPLWANNPVGRVVYSITSFLYSFYENVVKRSIKRVNEGRKLEGNVYAAQQAAGLLLPFALMWAAHSVVFAIRTGIFHPERDDEWIEKDEYAKRILMGGLSNVGALGPGDILWNAVYGLRWQRDLSNSVLGAHAGYTFQALESVLGAAINNSKNTNTAEHNAIQGLYKLTVAPAAGYLMATLPGGPLLGAAYAAGGMYATSSAASGKVADLAVGPKGKKKPKSALKLDLDMDLDLKLK